MNISCVEGMVTSESDFLVFNTLNEIDSNCLLDSLISFCDPYFRALQAHDLENEENEDVQYMLSYLILMINHFPKLIETYQSRLGDEFATLIVQIVRFERKTHFSFLPSKSSFFKSELKSFCTKSNATRILNLIFLLKTYSEVDCLLDLMFLVLLEIVDFYNFRLKRTILEQEKLLLYWIPRIQLHFSNIVNA